MRVRGMVSGGGTYFGFWAKNIRNSLFLELGQYKIQESVLSLKQGIATPHSWADDVFCLLMNVRSVSEWAICKYCQICALIIFDSWRLHSSN